MVSIICLLIFTLIQAEEKNSMFQLGRLSRLDNIVSHCKLVLKSLMFVTWDRSCNWESILRTRNWRCKLTKPSNLICWWSRCHILCINNCVSSNFLWHTLWSFLGIRHFPSDVKQMCLLWFRLVLGLQERGYVGDRSFHFGNGSSVIWRTLVFQIWRTNLSMVFPCRNLILLSQRFYKMTIWWETRILLTRNLNDCWNVNDTFGNLCAGFFSRDKTGRFGWEFSPWVYWWPLLRRTEMIDLDMGIQLFHRVFDSAVAVCHAWVVVPFSGEITKEVSREIQECEALIKTLVGLQEGIYHPVIWDSNKPLSMECRTRLKHCIWL